MSILVENLSKTFLNYRALDQINLEVKTGSLVALIGPSGSGKSTLLRIIAGLEMPDEGRIWLGGKNATYSSIQERDIGFVFQTPHFIKSLTVNENLKLSQYLISEINQSRINILLEKVGLLNLKDSNIQNLSEGEKQRISIIRALINQPSILLADEPTSALDDESCNNVIDILTNLSNENSATLIIVTHDKRLKEKFSNQIDLNDF